MRKNLLICLMLCLVLLCPSALAEAALTLSMEIVPAESILDFSITGSEAERYRYTLTRDGKELFSTESENSFGSYLPREKGKYTLTVTPLGGGVEISRSAVFTVTDKLTLTCTGLPDPLSVGGAAELASQVSGGTPPYRYVYAVTQNGEVLLEQTAGERWYWTPAKEGPYVLHAAVIDSQGAAVLFSYPVQVGANKGISLIPAGGGLRGHGGQESWMVCSAGAWTAETDCDFLAIDTPQGQPGDQLVITAASPTAEYRSGTVVVTSGSQRLEYKVSQSAGHEIEEEVFLFATEQRLYIDGQHHALWAEASGSRSFTVAGADAWEISIDGEFIRAEKSGDTLTVTVEDSDSAAVRSGLVTLSTPTGFGYLHIYQAPGDPGEAAASEPSGLNWTAETIYSQFSGLWKAEKYGSSTLEHSGCAIFALSHALDRLGFEDPSILPRPLAAKYAFCLRDGGTINATLVGNAGDDFGFKTRYELYTDQRTIRDRLDQGAQFSFAVVAGHIAMVTEASPDGSMMRIVDSAPSATWERIKNAQLYRLEADGSFSPITSLSQLEGIRYYPENDAFGGTTYWLESSYVAKRGVRLIQLRQD